MINGCNFDTSVIGFYWIVDFNGYLVNFNFSMLIKNLKYDKQVFCKVALHSNQLFEKKSLNNR